VLLEVSPHPFLIGTTHVSDNGMVCHQWGICFFFSFLSSSLKSIIWLFLLLVFKLQSLFFIFFYFFLCPFRKVLLVFNFIFHSKLKVLFFPIWSLLFWFLFFSWPFCKGFICFQFHPSIYIYGILFLPIWPLFFLFFSFC
jgi:hypothetical protein